MGLIASTLLVAIVVLARLTGVRYVERPRSQLVGVGPDHAQPPVTAQLAETVFDRAPVVVLVLAVTTLVLVLAANTTFDGFPVLGARLAGDRYLPRQLHTRGDRLAFSNGIVLLGVGATVLLVAFRADVVALIHLYIVGVFVALTLSQLGMVRYWRGAGCPSPTRPSDGGTRARLVNTAGAVLTGVVLAVILVAKFNRGAWLSIVLMAVVYQLMRAIRRHYDTVARELTPTQTRPVLPARNHAVVLVSQLHKPTMRALAYAQGHPAGHVDRLTVNVDDSETRRCWPNGKAGDQVKLTVSNRHSGRSPGPVVDYVRTSGRHAQGRGHRVHPRVRGRARWGEQLLHNQCALRLKRRLQAEPGVMVTSVPWQLASSSGRTFTDRMVRGPRTTDVPDFERAPEQ